MRLLGVFGEAVVIEMLEASDFDALDMRSPFKGGISDHFCDFSCGTITEVFTSDVDLLHMVFIEMESKV